MSLKQYNAQYQAAVNSGASKESLDKIQSDIDFATLMMKAIELAAQLRGIDLSEKKTTTRTTHENASKLISLIKEMRSEYDKLSKSAYGYAKSEEKVRDAYKQSYEEILKQTGVADNFDFVWVFIHNNVNSRVISASPIGLICLCAITTYGIVNNSD